MPTKKHSLKSELVVPRLFLGKIGKSRTKRRCSCANCELEGTEIHTIECLWKACTTSFRRSLLVAKVVTCEYLKTSKKKV